VAHAQRRSPHRLCAKPVSTALGQAGQAGPARHSAHGRIHRSHRPVSLYRDRAHSAPPRPGRSRGGALLVPGRRSPPGGGTWHLADPRRLPEISAGDLAGAVAFRPAPRSGGRPRRGAPLRLREGRRRSRLSLLRRILPAARHGASALRRGGPHLRPAALRRCHRCRLGPQAARSIPGARQRCDSPDGRHAVALRRLRRCRAR